MGDEQQRWHLVRDDHEHLVDVAGTMVRTVSWSRDGDQQATKRTSDETIVLAADGGSAVRVKLTLSGTARRITLHSSETEAHAGLGGTDFEPQAGSKAAERAEWIGRHPHLHTARQTALAAAGVGVPILVIWLLTLVPWPDVDLPSIPLPDLPSIPWPDISLPSIPWPEVDLPDLPGWVDTVRKFAVPILIAFFIARGEVKRRRRAPTTAGEKAEAATDEPRP